MERQKSMSHMKKTEQSSKKEFTRMKTSNILYAEFKTLVTRMHKKLGGRVDELSENFNEEIEN